MRMQFSKTLIVIAAIVALFLLFWIVSLIKCEILTSKYYDQFALAYQNHPMVYNVEYFKVLRCDGEAAEVYYVSTDCADVLEFRIQDGAWVDTSWRRIWSKHGSASNVVWPYWWQIFITGL